MKLEPPVPVPVDSIFSWGCDDDLLDSKFNTCDVADSTTEGLGSFAGSLPGSSGMVGLSCSAPGQIPLKPTLAGLLAMDGLDGLLLQNNNSSAMTTPSTPGPGPGGGHSFAELKPLPPFDYGPISSLDGSLNSSANNNNNNSTLNNNNNSTFNNNNTTSQGGTRTILDINLNLYKASSVPASNGMYYSEPVSTTSIVNVLQGLSDNGPSTANNMADYLMNPEIEDIAAIIGNAIADSTVATASTRAAVSNTADVPTGEIRDPWADIDAWIESACSGVYRSDPMLESPGSSVTSGSSHSSLSSVSPAFLHPSLPPMTSLQGQTSLNNSCSVSSTLQALLSQGSSNGGSGVSLGHLQDALGGQGNSPLVKTEPSLDMPLLQRRLTAGRDASDSHTQGSNHYSSCSLNKDLQQLPHTTFHSAPSMNHVTTSLPHLGNDGCHSSTFQTPRRGAIKKEMTDLDDALGSEGCGGVGGGAGSGKSKHKSRTGKSKLSTTIMTTEGGKEKPVHRCNICNRGFLNKSNIKVHLRTHTGEKPFKCDHCAKAFRQKAHLLKHMQIHKRISRD